MSEQPQTTMEDLGQRAKDLIAKGNMRRIVIKTQHGKQVTEMSLTFAVIVGAIFLFLPAAWPIALFGVIFAMLAKIRIEVVREIRDSDEVINVELDRLKKD